jgi:hypothetical protein
VQADTNLPRIILKPPLNRRKVGGELGILETEGNMPTFTGEEFFSSLGKLPTGPFGSLWWVPEDIWAKKIALFSNSTRTRHPGLSISKDRIMATHDPYSFLHGTSKRNCSIRNCVEVSGISIENGVPHKTFFGALNPVRMGWELFSNGRVCRCEKATVSDDEKQKLTQVIAAKGWQ